MVSKQIDIHEELVRESLKGSVKAQHKLYKLYANAMFRTCYNMMHNREDAEDMLQESFSEAFMTLERFRFESTFGTWLKRIVINKCLNEIKRRKPDIKFAEDMGKFEGIHDEEKVDLVNLNVDRVKEAMRELPEGRRMIFQLYMLEGYDHREIAEILNVSESNSKTQYMRARARIKEILNNRIYEN